MNEKTKLTKKNIILFIILISTVVAIVVFDQITKVLAYNAEINDKLPIKIIKGVISFEYVENFGGAFGSMSGSHVLFFILTLLALPAFCVIIFLRRNLGNSGCFGIALMFAGTIGNAIDRAFRGEGFFNGGVRDFIATECFGALNSVFNVADISLVVGVALFIAALLFFDKDSMLAEYKKKKFKSDNNGQEKDDNYEKGEN